MMNLTQFLKQTRVNIAADTLLTLEKDVTRPLDESSHVPLRLDMGSDLEHALSVLEQVAELLFLLGILRAGDFLLGLTFSH